METFDDATTVVADGPGRFGWTVPEGWHVGRGAWGGLVAGALIRCITGSEPDPTRVLRSVSATFSGPALAGPSTVEVTQMRRGSGLSAWSASLTGQRGEHVARLDAVLAEPRAVAAGIATSGWGLPAAPPAPTWDQVPVIPITPPLGPEFGVHIEARTIGGLPATSSAADVLGWIRLARPVPHTAASLIALVDAWWAAGLAAFDAPHPVATVGFSANLLVDPASVPGDVPLLHHGTASASHDGFTSELRRLWTADGRLAVENLQSMVVIA